MIEPKIDLGTIISTISLAIVMYQMNRKNVETITEIKVKVNTLWNKFVRKDDE